MSDVVLLPEKSTSDDEPLMWKESEKSIPIVDTLIRIIILILILIIVFGIPAATAILSHTSIYVQDVYVPALTADGTIPFNASIFVDLKFHRSIAMGFQEYYRDFELAVFYSHGITPVTGYRVRAFSMGWERTAHKMAVMEAPELPWAEAFWTVSSGSTVELLLEYGIRNIQPPIVFTAYVAVDASGHMLSEGPIELMLS